MVPCQSYGHPGNSPNCGPIGYTYIVYYTTFVPACQQFCPLLQAKSGFSDLLSAYLSTFFQKSAFFQKKGLTKEHPSCIIYSFGALAQLGAHNTGSVGVRGSNPLCSTKKALAFCKCFFHSLPTAWQTYSRKNRAEFSALFFYVIRSARCRCPRPYRLQRPRPPQRERA